MRNEKFEYEMPKLIFSEEKLEIKVTAGEKVRGGFRIQNTEERKIRGFIDPPAQESYVNRKISVGEIFISPMRRTHPECSLEKKQTEFLQSVPSAGEDQLRII